MPAEADQVRPPPGDLAKAAAGGDEAAWRALVERFSGLIWSVTRAYRLGAADAADVFQTTWLRLAEHIGRLDHPEYVGAWLATTARRESLRAARASATAARGSSPPMMKPFSTRGRRKRPPPSRLCSSPSARTISGVPSARCPSTARRCSGC